MSYKLIRRLSVGLAACILSSLAWAADDDYQFPLRDRFLATVAGTPPQLQPVFPENIGFRTRRIKIFENREPPEVIWYHRELLY